MIYIVSTIGVMSLVSPETLAMHVEVLSRHFTLVHLDDWLADAAAGKPLPARACAITFDDGWRDNHQYAFPLLKRAQAPATIFLVSDLVGRQYGFWPNSLSRLLLDDSARLRAAMPHWLRSLVPERQGRLDAATLDRIVVACKDTRDDAVMLDTVARLQAVAAGDPAERDLMDWRELRELADSGLVRFGSHTRRHTRLSLVKSGEQLRDEILGSGEEIARQLGSRPRLFCYPNGDYSDAALEVTRSGYQGAVTTRRGWHSPGMDPHLIQRIGVHEDISNRPASFLARLSGWL